MDDLRLPPSFLRLIAALRQGGWPYFVLKENVDAYGEAFDNGLKFVLLGDDRRSIKSVSGLLLARFLRKGGASPPLEHPHEADHPRAGDPGPAPSVPDFTRIVFFATGGEARGAEVSLYAFDFRDNRSEPSVICWQDDRWRRVAPDFETFLELFKLAPNRFQESDVGYWQMEAARIARTVRALARLR